MQGMLHTKVAHVDTHDDGGSQVARVGIPPSRYVGAYYSFSDPAQTAKITLLNKGNILFQKSGCAGTDPLQPYDQTKWPYPVTGEILVVVESISADSPGATLDVGILLDNGGAG